MRSCARRRVISRSRATKDELEMPFLGQKIGTFHPFHTEGRGGRAVRKLRVRIMNVQIKSVIIVHPDYPGQGRDWSLIESVFTALTIKLNGQSWWVSSRFAGVE